VSWPTQATHSQTSGAMLVALANILLRQARKTENPRDYLDSLITSTFTTSSSQGGVIVSTTVNGKSVTLQVPSGTGSRDLMAAANMALSCLERGLPAVPRQTQVVFR